jgi:hypothetical protein
MKKKLAVILTLGMIYVFTASVCNATVILDPSIAWEGALYWDDGLGQIDAIATGFNGTFYPDTDWQITVGVDSTMTLVTAWDGFIPGDEFALYLDNVETAWSSTFSDSDGYFHGVYNDLLLTADTHILTFYVTAIGGGTIGTAFASFSETSPLSAPVPEPATMLLLGSGLIGLAKIGRKKIEGKKSAA